MELVIIGLGLGIIGVYLFTRSNPLGQINAPTVAGSNTVTGQIAQQQQTGISLSTGTGYGVVTIGGQPAGSAWQPNQTLNEVRTGLSLSNTGLGAAESLTKTFASTSSVASSLSSAVPIVGSIIGAATSIISIISAHHAAAVQNEGKVLNTTVPTIMNDFVLVAQAALAGEVTTVAQAQSLTSQIVGDYYAQVKSIIHGNYPYTDTPQSDPTWPVELGGKGIAGVTGPLDPVPVGWWPSKGPKTCNAACFQGHYFIERGAAIVNATVAQILAGEHGTMILPPYPPNGAIAALPVIEMTY